MNIFTQRLPEAITIDGIHYGIHTDFRIWMEFDKIMNQEDIDIKDKIMMVLMLCLDKDRCHMLPESPEKAMECLCSFFLAGNKKGHSEGPEKTSEKVFSFSEDSGYIYSAFLSQYGIDLLEIPYLHWHVFMALFNGLDENCKLMKIIRWRLCDADSIKDEKRRQHMRNMKELYALSDQKKYKETEIGEILFKAF